MAQRLGAGQYVIDMSSIDPIAKRGFAERIEALGCHYVDAPVSGGEVGAKNAALTIMCGARPDVFEHVRRHLRVQGRCRSGQGAGCADGRFRLPATTYGITRSLYPFNSPMLKW